MDFNKFDTVSAAEKGAEWHIKDPVSLKPLYDNPEDPYADNGKPCVGILLGSEAPSVRSAARDAQKKRAAGPEGDSKDSDKEATVSFDEIHEQLVDGMKFRLVAFKNVRRGDKPAGKSDAEWFFNLNRMNNQEGEISFVEQAIEFSNKRANYLGNVSAA